MKRGLAISDLHCGSEVGLTPPEYIASGNTHTTTKRDKYRRLQKETWRMFDETLKKIGNVDFLLYLGDGIDGSGKRSGGTELITTDMEEQAHMCCRCIDHIKLRCGEFKSVGVYGTGYHTGEAEDFENIIARECGFEKIGSHEWVEVEGVTFDLKHHIGSSSVPHGRHTAVAKDVLWNTLWNDAGLQPKADVVIRGHVHYHSFCGNGSVLAMTMPALQSMGTKYGGRRCSGLVDWGMVEFTVDDGCVDWTAHLAKLGTTVAKTVKL